MPREATFLLQPKDIASKVVQHGFIPYNMHEGAIPSVAVGLVPTIPSPALWWPCHPRTLSEGSAEQLLIPRSCLALRLCPLYMASSQTGGVSKREHIILFSRDYLSPTRSIRDHATPTTHDMESDTHRLRETKDAPNSTALIIHSFTSKSSNYPTGYASTTTGLELLILNVK